VTPTYSRTILLSARTAAASTATPGMRGSAQSVIKILSRKNKLLHPTCQPPSAQLLTAWPA